MAIRGDFMLKCGKWRIVECDKTLESLEMRPRGTGDPPGNSRRGKMKDRHSYRTKLPNFSHKIEHVGPNKQISYIYLQILTRINLGYNAESTCFGII